MIRENVALHMDTQAGGCGGRSATIIKDANKTPVQIGSKWAISEEVLLNSKRVESPNPVRRSAKDGIRCVYTDSARDMRCID